MPKDENIKALNDDETEKAAGGCLGYLMDRFNERLERSSQVLEEYEKNTGNLVSVVYFPEDKTFRVYKSGKDKPIEELLIGSAGSKQEGLKIAQEYLASIKNNKK